LLIITLTQGQGQCVFSLLGAEIVPQGEGLLSAIVIERPQDSTEILAKP
jgi:hypothetical protein